MRRYNTVISNFWSASLKPLRAVSIVLPKRSRTQMVHRAVANAPWPYRASRRPLDHPRRPTAP